MLVLSRKVGERIVIGDDVVITVVEVSGNRVRIGIEAPRSKQVLRAEIIETGRPEPVAQVAPATLRSNSRIRQAVAAVQN